MSHYNRSFGINAKLETIQAIATDGFCYLKLSIMLSNFKTSTVDDFAQALGQFKSNCGAFPVCKDVFLELGVMDARLENLGKGLSMDVQEFSFNGDVYKKMMESRCRFSVEDRGQSFHVEVFTIDECEHDDVICNHGWSSRMAVVALAGKSMKIGGTIIDLNDIFGSDGDDESDLTMTPTEVLKKPISESPAIKKFKLDQTILSQQDTIDRLSNEISQSNQRLKEDDLAFGSKPRLSENELMERLLERMDKIEMRLSNPLTDTSASSLSSNDELDPSDSRSNLSALDRKYCKSGTVLTSNRNGKLALEKINETPSLEPSCQVVMGFVKTSNMEEKDKKVRSSIRPINGLAKPFIDNRLNMLLHFNTAVMTNMPINDDKGYATSLIRLLRHSPKTPSEQLTRMIISKTFDFEERVVISNSFKLPYIEVGMMISDSCLATCFSLLNDELRRLWFDNMKSLLVPDFHGKFQKFSESTLNGTETPAPRIARKNSRSHSSSSNLSVSSRSSNSGHSKGWFK